MFSAVLFISFSSLFCNQIFPFLSFLMCYHFKVLQILNYSNIFKSLQCLENKLSNKNKL